MAKANAEQLVGRTLLMGDEGFERYIDELVEECAHFIQLVTKLRQLPAEGGPDRDELETEFYASLAHLQTHSASLSEWIDRLIEELPED